jgi:hypothetical protein
VSDVLNIEWKISEDAVANAVGDEMVILHLENSNYYGLDPVGTVLWQGLSSGKKPTEVCDDILERFEAERERVEQDIARFLVDLEQNDLISRA